MLNSSALEFTQIETGLPAAITSHLPRPLQLLHCPVNSQFQAQWAKREIYLVHFNVEGVEMKLKAIAFRFVNRRWSAKSIDSHCCTVNC